MLSYNARRLQTFVKPQSVPCCSRTFEAKSSALDTRWSQPLALFGLASRKGTGYISRFRHSFSNGQTIPKSSHATDLTFLRNCAGEMHPQRHNALRSSWTILMRQRAPGSTGFYTTCLRTRVNCPREWTNGKSLLPEHCKDATTFARSAMEVHVPRGASHTTIISSCMRST